MSERKMWTENEDQTIRHLVTENEKKPQHLKWKWSEIAEMLQNRIVGCKRTGKQCRERWHNQLDPSISKDKEWDPSEIKLLFKLQDEMGNKWASISREMPGRTDNNIKNFFYSSLRRAIRLVNQYLAEYKKKSNIKPFKQTILTKILNINDEKYKSKLDIKKNSAIDLANHLKMMLAKISQQPEDRDLDQDEIMLRQRIIKSIQEFNKSCKKRKSKKQQSDEEPDLEDLSQYGRREDLSSSYSQVMKKAVPKKKATQPKDEESSKIRQNFIIKESGKKMNEKKLSFVDEGPEIMRKQSELEQKLKKRRSEAELLLGSNPVAVFERKINLDDKNSLNNSLEYQNFLKHSGFELNFLENDNIPELPRMKTRKSSDKGELKLFDSQWMRKDSEPVNNSELFEFGEGTMKPNLWDSYNFGGEGFAKNLEKISMGNSQFLGMLSKSSKYEEQQMKQ